MKGVYSSVTLFIFCRERGNAFPSLLLSAFPVGCKRTIAHNHEKGAHMKKKRPIGAHLSIAGGLPTVFDRIKKVGATGAQIFSKSNKSFFSKKPLEDETITAFKEARKKAGNPFLIVHANYLVNIASPKDDVRDRSTNSLQIEIDRCEKLGIEYLVFHPGAHLKSGVDAGIDRIAEELSYILAVKGASTKVLLETAAGHGTAVGRTFEELRRIYDKVDSKVRKRVGICLDTAHIHAAGYDIETIKGYEDTIQKFDDEIGLSLLETIHLNNSTSEKGSCVDRHANLNTGKLSLAVFKRIAQDKRLAHIPLILETPSQDGIHPYDEEIAFLKAECPSYKDNE